MSGVAGEQHAAVAKAFRHPLMHMIDRAMRNPVRLGPCDHALQHLLQRVIRQQLLAVGIFRRRHQNAPELGHPQQHQPFERIGDVIDVSDVGERVFEAEVGRRDQEQLRIGEAFELDPERTAHRAARAIGGDDIPARQ